MLNLIQPTQSNIEYWVKTEDVKKLEYALKFGNYKVRLWAAEALEKIGKPSSVQLLLNATEDKVQNVCIAALNTLETITDENDIMIKISRKRFNLLKNYREQKEKRKTKTQKKHTIYRWERTSKKNFEMVKERLKRPIR